MSTRLILIRHGETDWNAAKRYLGHADINLNKKGKQQAKTLCEVLDKKEICKVYSSDLKRAANFSKIIFKDFNIEKLIELREINFGIFEGQTYSEIMKKHSKIYKKWVKHPFKAFVPKAEKLIDFNKRVLSVFKKILSDNKNKTVAVVTHSGPIRMFINNITGAKDVWKVRIDNASITIVEYRNKKLDIKLLNFTAENTGGIR
jgi:alpha-ribazole phosphatase